MATSKQKPSDVIERKAINSSGRLGSLYDGCRDRIVQRSTTTFPEQCLQPSRQPQCELISGNNEESKNLLGWIGVQDELRLSLLFKSTKRDGIGAVLNYRPCIDEYTRCLYYSSIIREHTLKKTPELKEINIIWKSSIVATHIITSITIGIDVVVIIQLPSETGIVNKIDFILKKIRDALLIDKSSILALSSDENKVLECITKTKFYSNIPSLTHLSKISDLIHEVNVIKWDSKLRRPSSYTLKMIRSLYPVSSIKAGIFKSLSTDLVFDIEQKLLQLRGMLKHLEASLDRNTPKPLRKYLLHLLTIDHIQFPQVKVKFMKEIHRFFTLVVAARNDSVRTSKIYQALNNDKQIILIKSIHDVIQNLKKFKIKDLSITNPQQQKSGYSNRLGPNLNRNNDSHREIVDYVNTPNESNQCRSTNQRQISTEKDKNNSTSCSAGFNLLDLSFQTDDSSVSPSNESNLDKNHAKYEASCTTDFPEISSILLPSLSSTDDIINILLLGESGVGKSTFINAFANYLTFDSLEEAQSNEPIVIIPVSFIMTIGNNFEERTIKFGEFDSSDNENFNSVGQSVTQHCKSYIFDLHQFDGKKLRIIDTPGFGDTRGLDQDDRNMEHILQYISNITHLNAICFLLKPNSSRLNMFFRTCITQLFSFLAPTARKNIIFCFTNGRSTFYTPGDTAPLLKAMLKSLSISDISFEKENTFCFDSESFRYLVALQNDVSFNNEDKQEYQTSWSTSVKESNRLVDHINKNLRPYEKGSGWQSIKAAQFEISYMIRPMLEAMRNILRNLTFRKNNLSNQFIELSPKAVHHTATRCLSCKPEPRQIGKFWVLPTVLHEIQDKCRLCTCPVDQHVRIDYRLEYQCLYDASDYHKEATNNVVQILCSASAEFAHFLMLTVHSLKFDPFLIGLKEMIDEENQICQSQNFSHLNFYLGKKLTKVQELYELFIQNITERKLNQGPIDLPAIYRSIDNIAKYPMLHEQMMAVKQSQRMMMEDYELEVQTI